MGGASSVFPPSALAAAGQRWRAGNRDVLATCCGACAALRGASMQERQWQCLSPSPTRPPSRANHRQWSCAACKLAREEHFRQLVLSRSGHCALVLNRTRERLTQAFRSPNGVSLSMADPWSGPEDFWLDQANARQASLLRGGLPVCPYNWGSGHAKGWLFAPSVWAANARAPALRMDCSCDASLRSRPQRVAFLKKGSLHSDRVGRTGSPAERWCGSRSAAGRQFDAEIVECRGGSPFGIKWVKRRCISRNWTTMLDDQLSLRTQVLRRLLSPRPPDPARPDSCLGEVELFSRFNQVVLRPLPAARGFGVEARRANAIPRATSPISTALPSTPTIMLIEELGMTISA